MTLRRLALVGACWLALGARATRGDESDGVKPKRPASLQLEWTLHLSPDHARLLIDYKVTNHGKRRVWVSDLLPMSNGTAVWVDPSFIIVAPSTPGVVAFIRGRATQEKAQVAPIDPAVRSLAPGEALHGHAEVVRPMTGQYNLGIPRPLSGRMTRAVLVLGYFDDCQPTKLAVGGDKFLDVSDPAQPMDFLVSRELPLPIPETATSPGSADRTEHPLPD